MIDRGSARISRIGLCALALAFGLSVPPAGAGEDPQPTFVRMTIEWGSASSSANPATVVRVDVQLLDLASSVPAETIANFLRQRPLYAESLVHRLARGFVLQGGGYNITLGSQPEVCGCVEDEVPCTVPPSGAPIPVDYPIIDQCCAVDQQGICTDAPDAEDCPLDNEFSTTRPNTCGTIAMAKVGVDPDSAETQWFFNLEDNTLALGPGTAGGFTVFGQVARCSASGTGGFACDVAAANAVADCSTVLGFLEPLATIASLRAFDRPGSCPGPMLPAPTPEDTCLPDPNLCESCQGCPEAGSIASAAASLPLAGYSDPDFFNYLSLRDENLVRLRSVEVLENAVIRNVPEPAAVSLQTAAVLAIGLAGRMRGSRASRAAVSRR